MFIGHSLHPLAIGSPQFAAAGDTFWLSQRSQRGGFERAGWIRFFDAPDETAERPLTEARANATSERLRIDWTEKVDLEFEPETDGAGGDADLGALRVASFHGEVHTQSDQLSLSAADPQATAEDVSLAADAGGGELRSDHLTLEFERSGDGGAGDLASRITAKRLHARDGVMVTDRSQTLWAEDLVVGFLNETTVTEPESPSDVESIVAERGVQLRLPDGQRIFADKLEIDGIRRTAVLTGTEVRLVDANNLIDRARRITINERNQVYDLEGRGRFRRFDAPLLPQTGDRLEAASLDELSDRTEEFRIVWRESVHVEPVPGDDGVNGDGEDPGGRASVARFRGAVRVESPDMRLTNADELRVRFAGQDTDARGIEAIDADGGVHARVSGENAEIRCEHLHVDVGRNEAGQAIPLAMHASHGVSLHDEHQHIWASTLDVTFRPAASDPASAAASPTEDAASGEFAGVRVDVNTVVADGSVQLLLEGGERVFADRLVADGARETAQLTGSRVLVIAGEFVLDNCARLVVDRRAARYRVEGPGEFYSLTDVVASAVEMGGEEILEPIAAPVINGARSMEAAWTESAQFDDEENDGRGRLELRGAVHAESRPNPLEFSTVDADILTLEFEKPLESAADGAERELTRLIAIGNAKLENRIEFDEQGSHRPRVYYVAGQRIDYDQRTLEATVDGGGMLLTRDEWPRASTDDATTAAGFASTGTTRFRWTERLRMTHQVDDRYEIAMQGDVECIHRDFDGSNSVFTGQRLEATVVRGGAREEQEADAPARALKLGGSMKTRRLFGRGGIVVRTPDREVACDQFDYNLTTGLAEVSADPGRMVSILTSESSEPMRHERVLWDMQTDTITIYRGSAAGVP